MHDAKRDFEEFRTLVREDAEALMREPDHIWCDRWRCRCYNSFEAFLAMFPTLADRETLLRNLRDECTLNRQMERAVKRMFSEEYNIQWGDQQECST